MRGWACGRAARHLLAHLKREVAVTKRERRRDDSRSVLKEEQNEIFDNCVYHFSPVETRLNAQFHGREWADFAYTSRRLAHDLLDRGILEIEDRRRGRNLRSKDEKRVIWWWKKA